MRRHHHQLSVLLPMLVGAVAGSACGGQVSSVEDPKTNKENVAGSSGSSGSSTSSGELPTSPTPTGVGEEVELCTGAKYEMLEGVTTARAVDYMELRDEHELTNAPIVVAKAGTPCASATSSAKCQADLEALRSTEGWAVGSAGFEVPRHRYLVTTSGDSIDVITTLDGLRDFVAPVDTAKDAALLVAAEGKYVIRCDKGAKAWKTATGWDVSATSGHTCGAGAKLEGHVLGVTTDGAITVKETTLLEKGDPSCAIGRRPEGLVARREGSRASDTSAVGRFFAEAARLEAASVVAFERLAAELRELGAPEDLVEAAEASQKDEIRHARMTSRLARRFGADVSEPEVEPASPRSAFAIALENAVEGCVRETFGALVAHWQATAAADAGVAKTMRAIAADETRHAALAWDVAAWLEPRLADDERRAVEAARERAVEALRGELAKAPAPDLVAVAGMPSAAHALELLDRLDRELLRATPAAA